MDLWRAISLCGVLLAGCAPGGGRWPDDSTTTAPPDGVPPSACDVPALFRTTCATSGCHNAEDEAAGLDLATTGVADRVSLQPSAQCAGFLADAAHPMASVLYTKVLATNDCGSRMPLGAAPLRDEQVACLAAWISALLPPGENTTEPCPTCSCVPPSVRACYDGAQDTEGVGSCVAGEQECTPEGVWGPCEGSVLPAFEDCTTSDVDEDCDGQTLACDDVWSVAFGTDLAQAARSVAVDGNGDIYMVGDFTETVDFGAGPFVASGVKADVVFAKYDVYGTPIWAQAWGDAASQYGSQVELDRDGNVVLLGRSFGTIDVGGGALATHGTDDVLVAKFTPDGTEVWSELFGGVSADRADRLTTDVNGDVIVTGAFTGEIDLGFGPVASLGLRDAFVLKLDGTSGAPLFATFLGGTGDDYGFGVGTDASGAIYVAGRFHDTVTIGAHALAAAGGTDVYLAKLTGAGAPAWAESFGSSGDDLAEDLLVYSVGAEQRLALVGHAYGPIDFGGGARGAAGDRDIFLASFDLDGVHRWSALYGDAADQWDTAFQTNSWLTLAPGSDGNLWVGGAFTGTIDFGPLSLTSGTLMDMLVFSVDASGGFRTAQRFGGSYSEIVLDLEVIDDAFAVIGGRFFSRPGVDFGLAGSVTGAGLADGVLARIPL